MAHYLQFCGFKC